MIQIINAIDILESIKKNDRDEWIVETNSNKKIQAVSLTGSDRAGSAVGAIAGKYIIKLIRTS